MEKKYFFIYTFVSSSFSILFALYFQYIKNYPPCELCLYQRLPYYLLLVVSLFYFILGIGFKQLFNLTCLLFLISFAFSLTHVGVENQWWTIVSSCSSNTNQFENIDQLREFLEKVPLIKCDEVLVSFFGLSMATYNAIFSIFNLILALFLKRIFYG